jgi:hypothetical protein
MNGFITQEVVVPAWAWLIASSCSVYCVCELIYWLVRRKWNDDSDGVTKDKEEE